jgi:hypothetical protein
MREQSTAWLPSYDDQHGIVGFANEPSEDEIPLAPSTGRNMLGIPALT